VSNYLTRTSSDPRVVLALAVLAGRGQVWTWDPTGYPGRFLVYDTNGVALLRCSGNHVRSLIHHGICLRRQRAAGGTELFLTEPGGKASVLNAAIALGRKSGEVADEMVEIWRAAR